MEAKKYTLEVAGSGLSQEEQTQFVFLLQALNGYDFNRVKAETGQAYSIDNAYTYFLNKFRESGGDDTSGFLMKFKDHQIFRDFLLDSGFPTKEQIDAGEQDKDQMQKSVETMDLSVIMEDPSATKDFESFKAAVGKYLADNDLLKGTWVDDWNTESFRSQAMATLEGGGSMFGKLYGAVQERYKEVEAIKAQESKLETILDNVDAFVTDDYLARHKNLEKKLQENSLSPEGLMNYIFKTQKVPDVAFGYLKGKMPEQFRDFAEELQEQYDKRLEAKQNEFDRLFDQVFAGVATDPYDPQEKAVLRHMIYTSARNSRSVNQLNEWYDDDKTRFIKYRQAVDERVRQEKEMWEDIKLIGDFSLGQEHDRLRAQYQKEREQWFGGAYYSPSDQLKYLQPLRAKVQQRKRELESGIVSGTSSLESKMEGGAFSWGDNEKLGNRMKSYVEEVLGKASTLVEREKILRGMESRFPTLQSQFQAMYGLWEGMEKEVGKDNIDPQFLSQRDTLWKSMLGQVMPRDKSSFALDRWNISDQLSGLRKLVGDIRADRVKTLDEEQKKQDVEEKIKSGDISELPVDDVHLAKQDRFNEALLKSWGYTKSQFTAVVGSDRVYTSLSRLHEQWEQAHETHWKGVVSEQTSRINRKVDTLPGAYASVGKFFIEGMKKHAGPDKPTKKRHEWLLKNEPMILDTVNAMDRYVREYDGLMTPEFRAFVHNQEPQLGQKLNGIWSEITDKVANGEFGKLGSSLGGYEGKTKSIYDQCQREYQKYLQQQEEQAKAEKKAAEQEAADQKLERSFRVGESALDTRFGFFIRRHQAMASQKSGGATTTAATAFKNEAELKKAVLGGMTGLTAYADKEYFDEWIADRFQDLQEGNFDGDVLSGIDKSGRESALAQKLSEMGIEVSESDIQNLERYGIRLDLLDTLDPDDLATGIERLNQLRNGGGMQNRLDTLLRDRGINSGLMGTMLLGMLAEMDHSDFSVWRADIRGMNSSGDKRADSIMLLKSLFEDNELMNCVRRDLSRLQSDFQRDGLRLLKINWDELFEKGELTAEELALLEMLKNEEEAEKIPRTPESDLEDFFELRGVEGEYEDSISLLSGFRINLSRLRESRMPIRVMELGLERMTVLQRTEFGPLYRALSSGRNPANIPQYLFETIGRMTAAEFQAWTLEVKALSLNGPEDARAYQILDTLFGEDWELSQSEDETSEENIQDEETETPSEQTADILPETEVRVGHTIDLGGDDTPATAKRDDAAGSVSGEETEEDLDEKEREDDKETKLEPQISDKEIDDLADKGDKFLDDKDGEMTDEQIDQEADKGEVLLKKETRSEEDVDEGEEILEQELVQVLQEARVEGIEKGENLGARSVAESQEIDAGDDDDVLIQKGEDAESAPAKLKEEDVDPAVLKERPYATADDFSDEDDEEEMTDEQIDEQAEQGDKLLQDKEEEKLVKPLLSEEMDEEELDDEEEIGKEALLEDEIDALGDEDEDEEESIEQKEDEEFDEEILSGEELLDDEEELERIEAEEAEQAELEMQEAEEVEAEELAEQEALEEQERLEVEVAEQEELERIEAEEAEQAELEMQEAEEVEAEELAEQEALEEEERLEAELVEQEEQEELERIEAEEAEQAELESQEQERLETEASEKARQEEEALDTEITLEEQGEIVAEIRSWTEKEGWQLGVEGLSQATDKLQKGEVLEEKEREKLETSFDKAREALDQQQVQMDATEQESLQAQEIAEQEETLQAQEEERVLAEQQEAEKQAEVERMLAEFIELMVGEQEKAEMDRQKEEAEKTERKEQVLKLIADSARTDRSMEGGGGLDLDGVLDIFREDVADFGQSRLVKKIYHSKDVMRKARGMMEYFLSQDMYKQLLQLNMRSTSMLSEAGWHFFAELYGDVYVARVMTMQEILRRFYHYVSLLEEGDIDLQISVSRALLDADIKNAESVYRQLVGFYHSQKKQASLTSLKFENEGTVLRTQMQFGTSTSFTTITVDL